MNGDRILDQLISANSSLSTIATSSGVTPSDVNLTKVNGSAISLGNTTVGGSIPVTIGSNDNVSTKLTTIDTSNTLHSTLLTNIDTDINSNLTTTNINTSNTATNVSTVNSTLGTTNTSLSSIDSRLNQVIKSQDGSSFSSGIMMYGVRNDIPSQIITSDVQTGPLTIDQYGRILVSDDNSMNINTVSNNEHIKNYVISLISNMKIFYEYVFDSIAYSTNTLIKTWWELTIGTNQTITSSIGKGITFNSSENGANNRQTIMETRHKIPVFPNSMLVYQFGLDSSSAYNGTNMCSLYMGLLGYQANTIIGLIANNTTKFTIMDGENSIDQTSWNIDTFNGSGLSGETLTFDSNNYTFFMIFINGNNNEEILFGFYINGVPHPCHKIPTQNQTVSNTRKTRGTLIYYANSFTGNVGAFGSIYSIKMFTTQGHLGNISARMLISLNAGVSTVWQSWTTSTTKKTLVAITLNSTFANTNLCVWPLNIQLTGVITTGGKMMAELLYVNNDTYTFSGGTYSTATAGTSIGSIFDIYYNFTVEPTVSGLGIAVGLDSSANINTCNAFTNSFQLLGQTATNNTKTMLIIQVTPLNSTTGSIYGFMHLGYF